MMRRHIKLSAVLLGVVLALTGFSTAGHGHSASGRSHSGGSSGDGGGCSSSKKSNSDYDQSDYGSGTNGSGYGSGTNGSGSSTGSSGDTHHRASTSKEPTVSVTRCASPGEGTRKAVTTADVRLTAKASGVNWYQVDVDFLDASGSPVDTGEARLMLADDETRTVSVRMNHPDKVSEVSGCRARAKLSN